MSSVCIRHSFVGTSPRDLQTSNPDACAKVTRVSGYRAVDQTLAATGLEARYQATRQKIAAYFQEPAAARALVLVAPYADERIDLPASSGSGAVAWDDVESLRQAFLARRAQRRGGR